MEIPATTQMQHAITSADLFKKYFTKEYVSQLDSRLKIFAREIRKKQKDEYDVVLAVTGYPGSGKTTNVILLSWLINNGYTFEKHVCYIPTADEIKKKYYEIEQQGVFHIDEATKAMHKYRWWDSAQQVLNTIYDSISKDTEICFYEGNEFKRMNIEDMYNKYGKNITNLKTFVIDDDFNVILKPINAILQRPIRKPVKRMFKIRTRFNKEIIVTEDHSLLVFKNRGEKISKIKPTELKLKDKLIIPKNLNSIETINEDNDEMQFFGAWLADGCYNKTKKYYNSVHISGKEHKELLERMAIKVGSNLKCYNGIDYCLHNTNLIKEMRNKGFIGNSYTKRVPSWIFNTSKENKIAFLKGFMTGDGCINFEGRARVSSVNKELLRDIQILLMMIGIPTGWTSEKRRNKFGKYEGTFSNHLEIATRFHKIYVKLFESTKKNYGLLKNFKPLQGNMANKRSQKYIKNECVCITITRIEEVINYEGHVYDLSIDGIHRFIGNDILVSNTERQEHYKATILIMPRFQNFTENFRNFRIQYWINIIERGIAVVYRKDTDKDVKDPWHLEENYKMKQKKWMSNRKRIYERSIADIIRMESKTQNYWFYFEFPKLPEEILDYFMKLRNVAKASPAPEEQKPKSGVMMRKHLHRLYLSWLFAKEQNPELTMTDYARKTGVSQVGLSKEIQAQESDAKLTPNMV